MFLSFLCTKVGVDLYCTLIQLNRLAKPLKMMQDLHCGGAKHHVFPMWWEFRFRSTCVRETNLTWIRVRLQHHIYSLYIATRRKWICVSVHMGEQFRILSFNATWFRPSKKLRRYIPDYIKLSATQLTSPRCPDPRSVAAVLLYMLE